MITLVLMPVQRTELAYLCVNDLLRMYCRWAGKHGYGFIVTGYPTKQGAGQVCPRPLNSADFGGALWEVLHIDAPLELLAQESGVHRFRILSPIQLQPKIENAHIVVTVTGCRQTSEDIIRFYDYPTGKATDYRTKKADSVDEVLNGDIERLWDTSADKAA